MPNTVSCILIVSGSFAALERIKSTINIHFAYDKTNFPVDVSTTPAQTIIKFLTAWDPPNINEITTGTEPSEIKFIRMAWSEPGIWGYGWWQRVGNHTEKHVFAEAEMENDDDGSGAGVAVGEYKKFLEEEGF